ncbi:hypothetical protein MHU86_19461 [Fragilaria crotonensis]|nr:hypothetical protein MHU86_19461 [Fragilaria crotonensis]
MVAECGALSIKSDDAPEFKGKRWVDYLNTMTIQSVFTEAHHHPNENLAERRGGSLKAATVHLLRVTGCPNRIGVLPSNTFAYCGRSLHAEAWVGIHLTRHIGAIALTSACFVSFLATENEDESPPKVLARSVIRKRYPRKEPPIVDTSSTSAPLLFYKSDGITPLDDPTPVSASDGDDIDSDVAADCSAGLEASVDLRPITQDKDVEPPILDDVAHQLSRVTADLADDEQFEKLDGHTWRDGVLFFVVRWKTDETSCLPFHQVKLDYPRETADYIFTHKLGCADGPVYLSVHEGCTPHFALLLPHKGATLSLTLLTDVGIRKHQMFIGMAQWACTIGRLDIAFAVSSLSRFSADPRENIISDWRYICLGTLKSTPIVALSSILGRPLIIDDGLRHDSFHPDFLDDYPDAKEDILGDDLWPSSIVCFLRTQRFIGVIQENVRVLLVNKAQRRGNIFCDVPQSHVSPGGGRRSGLWKGNATNWVRCPVLNNCSCRLSDINLVRIYLQCTTLSDMRDHQDPRCITKGALSGERQSTFVTKCGWPRQEEPTSQQRRLWKRYISSQFLRYGTFWKRIPTDSLRDIKARRIKSSIEPLDGTNDVSFADMINSLPPYQRRLLTHINQCADDSAVWKASRSKGKITIASDGGLKDIRGTFGWTISTGDNTTLRRGRTS